MNRPVVHFTMSRYPAEDFKSSLTKLCYVEQISLLLPLRGQFRCCRLVFVLAATATTPILAVGLLGPLPLLPLDLEMDRAHSRLRDAACVLAPSGNAWVQNYCLYFHLLRCVTEFCSVLM